MRCSAFGSTARRSTTRDGRGEPLPAPTREVVRLSPPPFMTDWSPDERRRFVVNAVRDVAQESRRRHRTSGTKPLGARTVLTAATPRATYVVQADTRTHLPHIDPPRVPAHEERTRREGRGVSTRRHVSYGRDEATFDFPSDASRQHPHSCKHARRPPSAPTRNPTKPFRESIPARYVRLLATSCRDGHVAPPPPHAVATDPSLVRVQSTRRSHPNNQRCDSSFEKRVAPLGGQEGAWGPHARILRAMSYRFLVCDVFTDRRFGGNQLAVLPDASGLSAEQMQQVAR